MPRLIDVRLTVLGKETALVAFEHGRWQQAVRAKHVELYEFSSGRRVWWFQTKSKTPHEFVRGVSSRFPDLTFLLDYEDCAAGAKGLAKVVSGRVEHCCFDYSPTRD